MWELYLCFAKMTSLIIAFFVRKYLRFQLLLGLSYAKLGALVSKY